MIGIHRRRRVEGWASEVSEANAKGTPLTFRQRLSEDNRLWLVALGVIVIVTFLIFTRPAPTSNAADGRSKYLPVSTGAYTDQKHQEFTASLLSNKHYSDIILQAGYVADGEYRIVMPSNTTQDDIDYTSRMVARLIENKIRERAVVSTDLSNVALGLTRRVATTKWNPEKSAYVVTFIAASK